MNTQEKQQFLKDYADFLNGKTLEELQQIEQEVIKEAEEVDKEVNSKEFKLKNDGYADVAKSIRTLLDKQTIQWQYTVALVSMYEFWDPEKNPKKVSYAMLDTTLRTLGGQSYTGYAEAKAVVGINAYFDNIREEYAATTEKIYDIASKHNVVMEKMNLNKPIGEVVPGEGPTGSK